MTNSTANCRKRIAIVEDDPDQRRNYYDAIARKGYQIDAYASREEASEGIRNRPPNLAIIDIILGQEIDGGFDLCRELLATDNTLPILFLTERVDEIDRISGLRMGAWDYQPKPVSLDFLAERVTSLLRLAEFRKAPASNNPDLRILGQLSLDENAMQASWQETPLTLTMTEFRMLARLVRHPGHAISYEQLMNATMQSLVTHNTINTHMRNMRKKIRRIDPTFDAIQNEYGYGYRWVINCT